MSENSGHAELSHLGNVLPSDHVPFVGQDWIDPGVVRAITDGIVVKIRNRLVQIMQHLRFPVQIDVHDVARQPE